MSSKRYFLVMDVGTGSGRSIIFDQSGKQVSLAQREWIHPEDPEYPGAVDFNCAKNWKFLCECCRNSIAEADINPLDIAAVSATSMRHGIVCFDTNGEELFAVPNIDARANKETALLIEQGWGPKIYAIQGDWPSIHALARIQWLKKNHPDLFKRLRMMTMLSDWVIFRLSGRYITEPSVASSSGMFDIKARKWSDKLADLSGLQKNQLPTVLEPGTRVGTVSAKSAKETGLAIKTPVIIGAGDTQSGYIGSGVIKAGDAGLVAGSFWVPAIISDKPFLDSRRLIRTNCHAIKDQWIIESTSFYTGLALRWYRDAFYYDEIAKTSKSGIDHYEFMNKQAEKVPPGSYGIQVIMSDIGNNSHWIHAAPAFLNFNILSPDKYNKVSFYRALLENTAYQSLGEFENISYVWGSWPTELKFSGGGSNSPLLAQILSDTLNIPVRVTEVHEATALGTAAVAAFGAGFYSMEEACEQFVRWQGLYEPDEKRGEIYREAYRKWRKIYPHMMNLVKEELTRPMWRAPGT